jgi:hypothetical protein
LDLLKEKHSQNCTENGIYELSEEGLSPPEYYQEWLEIANTLQPISERT